MYPSLHVNTSSLTEDLVIQFQVCSVQCSVLFTSCSHMGMSCVHDCTYDITR